MPIEIPTHLTPELVPLSWLLGTWRGEGKLGQGLEGDAPFRQEVTFSQDGLPFLRYEAVSWLIDDEGAVLRPLSSEVGYWALDRQLTDADVGPGLTPAEIVPEYKSAEEVEALRNDAGGFDITATIVHPGGIAELYYGTIKGAVIEMGTDLVMRGQKSKPYASATRLYGLVNGNLFFRWDVQQDGELSPHASIALEKVSSPEPPSDAADAGSDETGSSDPTAQS